MFPNLTFLVLRCLHFAGAFSLEWLTHVICSTVNILTLLTSDPVYKIYVGCMRVLRTLLSSPYVVDAAAAGPSTPSLTTSSVTVAYESPVLRLLHPVLAHVIIKCADSNRRTSQLSLATIVELGKGLGGHLGAYVAVPGVRTAVEAVLDWLIQDSFPDGALEYQWVLGRLLAVEHLVSMFPREFT